MTERRRTLLCVLACLVLPFVLLHRTAPFFLSDTSIGRDYTAFSMMHQLEVYFSLRAGQFPLFIPGINGGVSSYAFTLGQHWHPIARLAS